MNQALPTAPRFNSVETAMLCMAAATLMLPGIDAIAKGLSGSIPAGETSWARFLFQSVLMFPLVLRVRGPLVGPHGRVHAMRGALLAVATLLFFSALKYLPIADAIAIFFVEPMLLTVLSAVWLGERVGWRRACAVLTGFVGAMFIIRPGFSQFGLPALLPIGTALSFAVYLILTRRLAQVEDPVRMQFFSGLYGFAFMSVALAVGAVWHVPVLDPVWPTAAQWGLLAALGLIATVGHLLVVHAFKRAEAGLLAPFQYLEIVSATALGYFFFGDFPEPLTWLGVAIIVASGLYIFHRERVLARA